MSNAWEKKLQALPTLFLYSFWNVTKFSPLLFLFLPTGASFSLSLSVVTAYFSFPWGWSWQKAEGCFLMPGCACDLAQGEGLLPSHAQLLQEAAACTVALVGTCLKCLNSTEESLV